MSWSVMLRSYNLAAMSPHCLRPSIAVAIPLSVGGVLNSVMVLRAPEEGLGVEALREVEVRVVYLPACMVEHVGESSYVLAREATGRNRSHVDAATIHG